jgi:broad specificity phosphatase PhoE
VTSPNVVMFIRHGEKPGDDGPPHGINHKGESDPHSLSVRGWTRAGALAALFAHAPYPTHPHVVLPERIMATKSTDSYKSKREVDTATPLAHRLGLPVDDQFDHEHAAELAASILADPRDSLVVWHHGSMPDVIAGLPVSNRTDIPHHWPEDRFDLIWVLSKSADDSDYRFDVVAQQLLDGDASTA